MTNLALNDLHSFDDEPRVLDLRLAEALGFSQTYDIRKIIERNIPELENHGGVFAMVAKTSPSGGRPTTEYHLNEAQALLICMFSRTENAAAVRKALIEVFLAWRQGRLTPPESPQREEEAANLGPLAEINTRIRMVETAERLSGKIAARALWRDLGLPELHDAHGVREAFGEDSLGLFVRDCIERAPDVITPSSLIYSAYARYCEEQKLTNMGQGRFFKRFAKLGFYGRKSNGMKYHGIRLKSAAERGGLRD